MHSENIELIDEVARYYSKKLALHGCTARGVDWNGEASQQLRFQQLCKIISLDAGFTVNDLGCGYGALLQFLDNHHQDYAYLGVDVAIDMIRAAQQQHAAVPHARFICADQPDQMADFGIASGIFNVRLERGDADWHAHMQTTLDVLDRTSRLGFAFNCLTSYSDQDRKRDYLYYADPCHWFDVCKKRYARNIALLHDYDLYEFTILVRKEP